MRKLRLVVTQQCDRACPGCSNNGRDLDALPVCTNFMGYEEILLTGGEPMLEVDRVRRLIHRIRRQGHFGPIILYTALPTRALQALLHIYLDGVTITLHKQSDVAMFRAFARELDCVSSKSLRLKIFEGVDIGDLDVTRWDVRTLDWIENCPLPEGEVFMRIEEAASE